MKNFDFINGTNTNSVNAAAMAELNAIDLALDSPATRTAASYTVIDRHTTLDVSSHKTRRAAQRKVDRLDNEYGGYKFGVRINWAS